MFSVESYKTFFQYCQWWDRGNRFVALQPSQPPLYNEDRPVHQLNAKVLRIFMTMDMAFFPGWQNLNVNETNIGYPVLLGGDPRTYFLLGDIYREYCRTDFGMYKNKDEQFITLCNNVFSLITTDNKRV